MVPLISLTAFAKESAVHATEDDIILSETQTAFEMAIEIEPENAYAGVEIGLDCPEGVVVTASSGSSGSMSAGPVLANGLYWTSFFESDNSLSGPIKITLQLSCPEAFEIGDIRIAEVKVLAKDGVSVVTERLTPSQKIRITRDGFNSAQSDTGGNSSDTYSSRDENGSNAPTTGDTSRLPLFVALLVSCGAILGAAFMIIKKRKTN